MFKMKKYLSFRLKHFLKEELVAFEKVGLKLEKKLKSIYFKDMESSDYGENCYLIR